MRWQWITKRLSRQWWLALLLSLLLHLLLFSQWQWSLWLAPATDQPVIEARLMAKPLPPPKVQPPSPVSNQRPVARPQPTPSQAETPALTAPIANVAPMQAQAEVPPLVSEPAPSSVATLPEVAETALEPSPTLDDTEGIAPPYTQAETEFAIYVNHDKRPSGTANIRYEAKDQQYALRWQIEGSGLLKLLYPSLVQESRGSVSTQGLRPNYYRYAFGQRANKTFEAKFNWDARLVTLVSHKGEVASDLPANTQDILSFMYQFMFVPPLQMMQVALTNGKRVGEYEYAFEGEEAVQVGNENLQTVHIAHQRGEADEKVELWLATDYRYLPVKIRKIDKHGMVIEQIATQLKVQSSP